MTTETPQTSTDYMAPIDICNIALGYLNHPAIATFDEDLPEAALCRRLWPMARDLALSDHAWSFSTRVVEPALLAGPSPYPHLPCALALPGDCLRVAETVPPGVPYVREGSVLYAARECAVAYSARDDDTSRWPAKLCDAAACALASRMAMPLGGDAQAATYWERRAKETLEAARADDSIENYHAYQAPGRPGRWLSAHLGGGGY